MIRTFDTHQVREQKELTSCLWEFTPCQGENAGKTYKVAMPSCWETYPDFGNYRGEAIYKTTFRAEGNIRLEFKGVSHTATVYVDGEEVARHYNAYTAFEVIVRDLEEGEHVLEVKADNRFSEESALHIPNDYMTYGGITRPVVLELIDDVYINYVHVTPYTCGENCWDTEVKVKLTNISDEAKNVTVSYEFMQWGATECITIEANSEFEVGSVSLADMYDVEVWEPENPKLYNIYVTLSQDNCVIDDMIDRFGFREVKVEGKQILINGKAPRIKGVCRHEDHPQFGCALPYAAMAADLEIIKHLGANSVRTVHYPNDEIFLDLCDEMGILVWEENHARGLSLEDMQNPNFEPQAEKVIEEMIELHYNHPSIYIWGILNECASETEYGKECYRKQFELIKSLDTSRPTSFASCKFKTDVCFGLPDVVSFNIYPLWYHNTPMDEYLNDLYGWIQNDTEGTDKPFLITEVGAGGIYGYRNNYNSKWTEDYQAETLEKQLTAIFDFEDCQGVYIWQFCDVRVSDEWFHARPRTMNNKGIVDEFRRRKLCYNVVKQIYESVSGNYTIQ